MRALQRQLSAIFAPTRIGDACARSEQGKDGSAMVRAHELARGLGVRIEKEAPRAYWVFAPAGVTDPLEGNNFCTSGREVLATVQAYADHFNEGTEHAQPHP